jgi:hypothetical protein
MDKAKNASTITVKRLKDELALFPDDYEITFNGLEFYRTKLRGEKLVQIEFTQTVYQDEQGNVVVENH